MSLQLNSLKSPTVRPFTLGEEITHSITHGIGAGLSIAGLSILVMLAVLYGNVYQTVSFSIYGATLIILYLASTLYHSFQQPRVKQIFEVIDHAAIYLLIAGTYTPFLLVAIRGVWGWGLLIVIWALAIVGLSCKAFFIDRFRKLSTLGYVLMGWLCVLVIHDLVANLPLNGLIWLAVGGVVYTVGAIFYEMRRIPYTHAIWHLFVLGGSICHYFAILLYLAPIQ